MNTNEIAKQVDTIFRELIKIAGLIHGDIIVLGASSSEILGKHIGKASSPEIGHTVASAAYNAAKEFGLHLAVQGCEHINRALAVESAAAKAYGLEIVNVRPMPEAGGAVCAAAYELMDNAVMAEHISAAAGVDIGDTSIGMHVKFVQVPIRLSVKNVGSAHVTALKSRPKLIGGERARYN